MKVGFIGLGAMGAPMAWNVFKAGMDLAVYNRNAARCQPFAEQGVFVAQSPAELAARVDRLVVMVTGPEALEAVLFGPQGAVEGLAPGSILVNMSTVSPTATLASARRLKAQQVDWVDAPVSGTVGPAQTGQLVVLAGAEPSILDRVRPLLAAMGSGLVECGPVGAGTQMKLAVNLLLAGAMETLAESMIYAQSAGLAPERLMEALGQGALNAPLFLLKGQAIIERRFTKAFPVDLVAKDLGLVLDDAERTGVQLPQTRLNLQRYHKCQGMGHGDEDMAALVKVLEETAQIEVRGSKNPD
ncbi:MAG: NAD(P)-dependent oxidoreductase [bacterium]|nr:NAD(P)-dependent oxidoreductase [bacterium]